MFVGMKQQLKPGEHFKATLEFAKAGKVDVDFTVEGHRRHARLAATPCRA